MPDVTWKEILKQPAAWYKTPEAAELARTVIRWQHPSGGWDKNVDMTAPPTRPASEPTIDNGATTTQIELLARIGTPEARAAALKGIDYLLAAQYPNGGWPQFFPLKKGYYTHITFNDDAMVNALTVLRSVARGEPSYRFVDAGRQKRCAVAVEKGIACILKCQVVLKGRKTVWCAQHDERTLAPAKARAYELPSLSGSESVNVVRFLMDERPTPAIRDAIESAVRWLEGAKIVGVRYVRLKDDRLAVPDPNAPLLWARFYDLDTEKPFFCGRDGVKKASLAEIERERRKGYAYYTDRPGKLIAEDYPAWKKKR